MQQQSHLIQTPGGAFKGHLRAASHISVQCISCMVWKKDETHNLVLWDYTYVLSHTHAHTGCSLSLPFSHTSTLRTAVVLPHLIFADLYVLRLTEVSTQSPDAQTQRIGSPLG